jgi:hypothetical protein
VSDILTEAVLFLLQDRMHSGDGQISKKARDHWSNVSGVSIASNVLMTSEAPEQPAPQTIPAAKPVTAKSARLDDSSAHEVITSDEPGPAKK